MPLEISHYIEKHYQYFRWFYFINNVQSIASKSSFITSKRIGFSAELKISKTSVEMLSIPYMTFCKHFGCRHDFYKITLDYDYFNYNSDSVILIKRDKKKILVYHAEPKLEFVDFISNIGGLFGLYFGLSFIDLSELLKLIGRRIKFNLRKLIQNRKIKALIEYLKLSHDEILGYTRKITKIPWKLIIIFISTPFFISKMFELIKIYFQYSTQISFEFVEYQQKNQKISINEFPAITVCTEHMFEKAFFDKWFANYNYNPELNFHLYQLGCDGMKKRNINLTTCNINVLDLILQYRNHFHRDHKINLQILSKYFDISTQEEYHHAIRRIEDKSRYGLNGTLDLLDFYVNHYNCWTFYEPNIKCNVLKPMIKMLSPFGKCHTYLMGNNNNETFVDKIALYTGDAHGELKTYLKRKFILHSSNHLPIWTSDQFRVTDIEFGQQNSFVVRMNKIEMNKLPPPYDQNCRDYSESQQFECMNKCIEKYYQHKFKCFPNKNNYYTIIVYNQDFRRKFIFCNESEFVSKANNFFASTCQYKCAEPCLTINFDQDFITTTHNSVYGNFIKFTFERSYEFIYNNVDYLNIIWLPQLTIISLFIKIFNILNLWNGINFKQLIDIILQYAKHIYAYIFHKIASNINWKNYIDYEITKVRFA